MREKEMTSKSPIFPIVADQSPHFTDYGFDPHFDYFKVLEEPRKHTPSSRSIDTPHFKLQKPISTSNESKKIKKNNKNKTKWWKNALVIFKNKWAHTDSDPTARIEPHRGHGCIGSISGPVYITESLSGRSTPHMRSGPLRKGDVAVPYISLRELNMDPPHRISASSMPIYLVT